VHVFWEVMSQSSVSANVAKRGIDLGGRSAVADLGTRVSWTQSQCRYAATCSRSDVVVDRSVMSDDFGVGDGATRPSALQIPHVC
jgi:hypothetical protein